MGNVLCFAVSGLAQTTTPEWVKRSNANAQILLDVLARFSPESAARFGVEGFDAEITPRIV